MPMDEHNKYRKRKAIVDYFQDLDEEQEFGVKKHTSLWCLAKTAHRFYLTPRSVERYVYGIN